MGCIYGAVAFLLFHWHALLHSTAENAALTRTIIQQQQAQAQQRGYDEDIEETPDVLGQSEIPFVRTMNHTEMLSERPEKPMVVAYAISVIKVSDGYFELENKNDGQSETHVSSRSLYYYYYYY